MTEGLKVYIADNVPLNLTYGARTTAGTTLRMHCLISYFYYKNKDIGALYDSLTRITGQPIDIMADSGAYSAAVQNIRIDVAKYADWLQKWQKYFSVYVNMDDVSSWKLGLANQQYLENRGLKPLPVIHAAEPVSLLKDFISGYAYIGLGGIANSTHRGDKVLRWYITAFDMAGSQSVYHGFAVTAWKMMKALPWYSVDSSSWGQGFRYGSIPVFDEVAGRWHKIRRNAGDAYKLAKLVRKLGFEPEDFAAHTHDNRDKVASISALSYMQAERWIRNWRGSVKIPDRQDSVADSKTIAEGLKVYLASGNAFRELLQEQKKGDAN